MVTKSEMKVLKNNLYLDIMALMRDKYNSISHYLRWKRGLYLHYKHFMSLNYNELEELWDSYNDLMSDLEFAYFGINIDDSSIYVERPYVSPHKSGTIFLKYRTYIRMGKYKSK